MVDKSKDKKPKKDKVEDTKKPLPFGKKKNEKEPDSSEDTDEKAVKGKKVPDFVKKAVGKKDTTVKGKSKEEVPDEEEEGADEKDKKGKNPFAKKSADSKDSDKVGDPKAKDNKNPFTKEKEDKSLPGKRGGLTRGSAPTIKDSVVVDFEPEVDNSLHEEEVRSLIESNLDLFSDAIIEEYLGEFLSVSQRMRKRQQIRRYKAKMQMARRRSMRRRASTAKIKMRALRTARSNMKRKLAGGRSTSSLTYTERGRIERLAARRKGAIQRQARRLIVKKRAQERLRLSRR